MYSVLYRKIWQNVDQPVQTIQILQKKSHSIRELFLESSTSRASLYVEWLQHVLLYNTLYYVNCLNATAIQEHRVNIWTLLNVSKGSAASHTIVF